MKIYLVGGAVRDKLLNLPIKERDWVVVGATAQKMLSLGYKQVGKEFPVFLDPKTNEEYALARIERKYGPGYKGFTFDISASVTLEEDLLRRDLTINAMAETKEGQLIDPYHGKDDLDRKLLRHVSDAFAEDPVRILRVGRFLARYAHRGFHVAPETIALMRKMVGAGEVDALVAERVWKELDRALGEKNPEAFFTVLDECHALAKLFPNLDPQGLGIKALQASASLSDAPVVRFAALLHNIPDAKHAITALCLRYRAPNHYRDLATLTAVHYKKALTASTLSAAQLIKLFNSLDIYRREARFKNWVIACQAIALAMDVQLDHDWLIACAQVAKSVDVQALIAQGLKGGSLVEKIIETRQSYVEQWLASYGKK